MFIAFAQIHCCIQYAHFWCDQYPVRSFLFCPRNWSFQYFRSNCCCCFSLQSIIDLVDIFLFCLLRFNGFSLFSHVLLFMNSDLFFVTVYFRSVYRFPSELHYLPWHFYGVFHLFTWFVIIFSPRICTNSHISRNSMVFIYSFRHRHETYAKWCCLNFKHLNVFTSSSEA